MKPTTGWWTPSKKLVIDANIDMDTSIYQYSRILYIILVGGGSSNGANYRAVDTFTKLDKDMDIDMDTSIYWYSCILYIILVGGD